MSGETDVTVVTTLVWPVFFGPPDCGRVERPAFPAPFVWKGPNEHAQLGRNRAAGTRKCILIRRPGLEPGPHNHREWGCAKVVEQRLSIERPRRMGPGSRPGRRAVRVRTRSTPLTNFWHCGLPHFSFRTAPERAFRQPTVNGFGRESRFKGSGNADSRPKARSSGWSGQVRWHPRDSGCVAAHPAYWRPASYRPLRAVWAVCAWALRGSRDHQTPSALQKQRIS
jgi:hypothetical protein